jgi:hypothetical protein
VSFLLSLLFLLFILSLSRLPFHLLSNAIQTSFAQHFSARPAKVNVRFALLSSLVKALERRKLVN